METNGSRSRMSLANLVNPPRECSPAPPIVYSPEGSRESSPVSFSSSPSVSPYDLPPFDSGVSQDRHTPTLTDSGDHERHPRDRNRGTCPEPECRGKEFSNIYQHRLAHRQPTISCPIDPRNCQVRVHTNAELARHIVQVHWEGLGIRLVECEGCGAHFARKPNFDRHKAAKRAISACQSAPWTIKESHVPLPSHLAQRYITPSRR